jgi:AcrR family transcriptional regulator
LVLVPAVRAVVSGVLANGCVRGSVQAVASRKTPKSKKREPLNPDRIAHAALAFIDERGLDEMSVRNLGAALGVEGMALYKHFPSKEAILDAVSELLILELVVPAPGSETWKTRALRVAHDYRAISRRHPRAFPLLASRRFTTPRALALTDRIFFALMADGLTAQQAVQVYRGVANWSNGTIFDELAGFAAAEQSRSESPVPRELTALAAAQPFLANEHFDAIFETGLDALLTGLELEFQKRSR